MKLSKDALLEAVQNYLVHTFNVSTDSRQILFTLLEAIYDSGLSVGYHSQNLPEDVVFMNILKTERAIHRTCRAVVFPMWADKPTLQKLQNLLWWCPECCKVLNNAHLDTVLEPLES